MICWRLVRKKDIRADESASVAQWYQNSYSYCSLVAFSHVDSKPYDSGGHDYVAARDHEIQPSIPDTGSFWLCQLDCESGCDQAETENHKQIALSKAFAGVGADETDHESHGVDWN